MKSVLIEVTKDGIKLKTEGFVGEECIKEVDKVIEILKNLGVDAKTLKIQKTEEYYKTAQTVVQGEKRG